MWIDITWMILAVYGVWKGWKNGIILSVFTTLAWGAGLLAAVKFSAVAAKELHEQFDFNSVYMPVISFLAVFIVIALVIYLVGKALEQIVEIAQLGFLNRFAGIILYVGIYTVVFSVFIWLLDQVTLITPFVKQQSKTYPAIFMVYDFIINNVSSYIPLVNEIFQNFQEFLNGLAKSVSA